MRCNSRDNGVLGKENLPADVTIIGIPSADLSEQLLALIVPTDPTSPPTADDLALFCRERLAAYMIPRQYEYFGELVRN